jgi:hypothetical protein
VTRIRGSVMLETALFVSAALLFMLGTMQIGGLGFLQLTSDGAAYFDARANVLAVTSGTAENATHLAFTQIPAADIQPTAIPAPTPTVPVDYGYNSSSSTEQSASAVNRHGGASMLQPVQEQSTVAVPGLMHILGKSLGVDGTAIEAKWLECDPHFDVSNAASCSQSNPSATQQTDYFSNGEHTPPYFVGFNYLEQCALGASGPWGLYTGSNENAANYSGFPITSFNGPGSPPSGVTPWNGPCSSGQNYNDSSIEFIAMGSAEYLDAANWQDSSPGASGACDTSKLPNPGTAQGVFEAAAFHQRQYAIIGEFLSYSLQNGGLGYVELSSYYADPQVNKQNLYGAYVGTTYGAGKYTGSPGNAVAGNVATPETVDTFANVTNSSGMYAGTVAPGYSGSSFTSPGWEGFDTATYYPGDGRGGIGQSDIYNVAVQTVYGWDRPIQQGQPPSDPTYNNPTYPEFGCS